MRSTNTSKQKNNNQAKDVFSFDNFDNSFSSDDTLLAIRESFVIRDKQRSHRFISKQDFCLIDLVDESHLNLNK